MTGRTARVFWYSQTGHSYSCALKAAETLQKSGYAVNVTPLALAEPAHFQASQILFAFPVNNFQVPVPMVRLFQRLPVVNEIRDAFAIITYAGLPANTAHLFKRLPAGKNLRLQSFVKIRCRDANSRHSVGALRDVPHLIVATPVVRVILFRRTHCAECGLPD